MSTQALRTCVYLRRLEFLKQRTAEAQRLLAAAEQRALEAGAFRHSPTTVDSLEQPRTLYGIGAVAEGTSGESTAAAALNGSE